MIVINNDILDSYFDLLTNYTKVFYKNIFNRIDCNENQIEYIYTKGIIIINNIFNINLIYQDDIQDVCNITEKGYIYFIEFISQIYSNKFENNIELTIKDAVLFCYKKTITNNNNLINTNTNKENKLDNDLLNKYIRIINLIFFTINSSYEISFNNNNMNDNNYLNTFIKSKITNISRIYKKIKIILNNTKKKVINENSAINVNNSDLENILNFFNYLYSLFDIHTINKISLNEKDNFFTNIISITEKFLLKKNTFDINNYDFDIKIM